MIESHGQPEITSMDFKNLKNKFVHTMDGDLLGTIESLNKDCIMVKKNVTHAIYYNIPRDKFERWDGHALWLNITERQASQNHISTTNNDKISFEVITFRLNETVMDSVRVESDNRTISVNALVNHILKRFVEWDNFEPMSGMIHIPKPVVIEIFSNKSDDDIIRMAKSIGKNAISNTVLFMKGEKDLNTFLSWIETEMKNHSLNVRHVVEGNTHSYIIKHDMGYKFSLYYKTVIESIFNDYFEGSVNFTLSEELLLFKFNVP